MRCFSVLLACLLFLAPVRADDKEAEPEPPEEEAVSLKPRAVLETGGHFAAITKVFFTPDGKQVVSVGAGPLIRFWDAQSGELLRTLRPNGIVGRYGQSTALTDKGKTLVLKGQAPGEKEDNRIVLFLDLETGRVREFAPRRKLGILTVLTVSPDGEHLATGHWGSVHVWDVKSASKPQHSREAGPKQHCTTLAFSPDSTHVAFTLGKLIHVEEIKKRAGRPGRAGKLTAGNDVHHLDWTPDGKELVVCRDDSVQFFDAQTHRMTRQFSTGVTTSITFLDRGQQILTTGTESRGGASCLTLRDATGKVLRAFPLPAAGGSPPLNAAVSPDGKLIAVAYGDHHTLALYNRENGERQWKVPGEGEPRYKVQGQGDPCYAAGWSPDGTTIAWGNAFKPGKDYHTERPLQFAFDLSKLEFVAEPDFKTFRRAVLEREGEKLVVQAQPELWRGKSKTVIQVPDGLCFGGSLLPADSRQVPVALGTDGFVRLGNPKAAKPVRLAHPGGEVYDVAPSPDGKYLLAAATNQTLRVYTLGAEKEKHLLEMFFAHGDWVVWTSQGYYAASPGGEKLMGWTVGHKPDQLATFYPAERFRKQFYRPDVVKLVLEKGSVAEALKAANEALMAQGQKVPAAVEDVEQLLPPTATLKLLGKTGSTVKVQVKASASDKQLVESVRLLLNGRPLPEGKGVKEYPKAQARAEETFEVELPPGKHELKVLVRSPDAAELSNVIEENIPVPKENKPVLHVLCVGVNDYQQAGLALKAAAPDATAISAALAKSCVGDENLFGDCKPNLLTDKDATRQKILGELTNLRKQVKQQDLLVVFFAGHGVRDKTKNEFYLLPVDANTDKLADTALSGTELREKLSDVPCQVLLVLDACHSAAGVKAFKPAIDEATRTFSDDTCGVVVMSAAMGSEFAIERGGQGLFTKALVKALQDNEHVLFNVHDRKQYLHHLQTFAFDEVQKDSQGRQHPFLSVPWITTSFPLRQVPGK